MGSVEEVCLVCADPLDWTAVGSCGHNLTCSQCVARLRFVLHDKRCTVCQQDVAQVLFTRYMGDYTARLSVDQVPGLKARVASGDLYFLPEVEGYFDDAPHYAEMKALCGYEHPILTAAPDKARPPTFTSFVGMKKWIESNLKVSFCDLCVLGRKVFICEQLVYDKPALEKHNRIGDDTGPMAESGFKGHPACNFCKKRFYDSTELYRHMESQHEHCFMCRREHPDKYVYYRHYQELEEHFASGHQLCPHPSCLEKRFVVFGTEAELKRHFAIEHGDDAKMSRSARREALTIPLNLQYRRDGDGGDSAADEMSRPVDRPGTVIGGGQNVTSRHGPRAGTSGRGGGGRGDAGMSAAVQASLEALAVDNSLRESGADADVTEAGGSVTFQAEDFPLVGPGGSGATGAFGRWAGGASGSGAPLSQADFPALPTLSKNARKKLGSKARQTLAERLAAAAVPIRVINKSGGTGTGGTGVGGTAGLPRPPSTPSLGQSAGMSASRSNLNLSSSAAATAGSSTISAPGPAPVLSPPAATWVEVPVQSATAASRMAPPPAEAVPQAEDFPSLSTTSRSGVVVGPPSASTHRDFSAVATSQVQQQSQAFLQARFASASAIAAATTSNGTSGASASAASRPPPPPPPASLTTDDFPTLGGGVGPSSRAAAGSTSKKQGQRDDPPAPPAAGAAAVAPGGVSERLKAANRELVDKCKRRLTDEGFAAFRFESGRFMRGDIPAEEFHTLMVEWGLLSLASELAVLCPRADRRQELLDAHSAYLTSPAAHSTSRLSAGWTPPEAALAAAAKAEACPSWSCARCTLINAPNDSRCEACSAPRPNQAAGGANASSRGNGASSSSGSTSSSSTPAAPQPGDFPSLGAAYPARGSFAEEAARLVEAGSDAGGAERKGKKGKVIRLGGPPPGSGGQGGSSGAPPVHPQNVWTQPETIRKNLEKERLQQAAAPVPQASKGQWAAGGGSKISRRYGALNDAWGSS